MKKLTFKEYIQSKTKLYEAIEKTPQRVALYTLRKYCKLPVNESEENKKHISLKPKQKLSVSWLYEDIDNPKPICINFPDVDNVDPTTKFSSQWKGERLLNWLIRNTFEEIK